MEEDKPKKGPFGRPIQTPKEEPGESPMTMEQRMIQAFETIERLNRKVEQLEKSSPASAAMSFSGLAEEIAKAQADLTGSRHYVQSLDPSDILEKPVTFAAHGSGMNILDDMQNGQATINPSREIIRFRFAAGYTKMVNGREHYFCYSTATVRSKKVAEWLRNHSRFNIDFFDEIELANKADQETVMLARQVNNHILGIRDKSELMQLGKKYGIEDLTDEHRLRKALNHRMLAERIEENFDRHKEEENNVYRKKLLAE